MLARLILITVFVAPALVACATLGGAGAPSCDGASRRPLNRSLWNWEDRGPAASAPTGEPTPVDQGPDARPIVRRSDAGPAATLRAAQPGPALPSPARVASGPALDFALSHRPCRA